MKTPPRAAVATALLLCLPGAARSQAAYQMGGMFDGIQTAATIVEVVAGVAVIATVVYLVHNQRPTITGCVQTVDGTRTMTSEANQKRYTLVGPLPPGDGRFKLQGTGFTAADGSETFRVERIARGYGACK